VNFASGLNLYYGVQNLASLPQQWLIAKERAKVKPRVSTPVAVAPKQGGPPKDRGRRA
jgi:membrane protein insertase Oxa1/YidC/SpoIIIJ